MKKERKKNEYIKKKRKQDAIIKLKSKLSAWEWEYITKDFIKIK